jgi:hypothetical protein
MVKSTNKNQQSYTNIELVATNIENQDKHVIKCIINGMESLSFTNMSVYGDTDAPCHIRNMIDGTVCLTSTGTQSLNMATTTKIRPLLDRPERMMTREV